MEHNLKAGISSSTLHILAMAFMLCDHLWAMIFPAEEWLTCIGRVAYPIFAFMIAEGFAHTHDFRKYVLRIFVWACITEIPFNLMYGGSAFYPFHQNVLWTFLESLLLMALIEKCRERFSKTVGLQLSAAIAALGFALGYLTMTDYYGVGVVTVLVFYFFREKNWKNLLAQIVCLYILNVKVLGGYYYTLHIFGFEIELVQQALALLSLIPIWLYQGRKGIDSKGFKYACYAFYPVHIAVLIILRDLILM